MSASIASVNLKLPHILLILLSLLTIGCRSVDDSNQELFAAVAALRQDDIRMALSHGANPNATRNGNETALGLLIQQYKRNQQYRRKRIAEAATLLLEGGADANALHHGFTPLQIAAGQRSEVLVSRLLVYGANPNQETPAGLAPIWQAVYDNNYKIGLLLLKAGANPNAKNTQGQTPLQYLRAKGSKKTRLMLYLRYYGGV